MKKMLIVPVLGALLLAGCSGSSDNAKSTGGDNPTATSGGNAARLKIAVIPKGATHEYWKSIHEGANRAGAELGVDILWKGPLKEDDRESQITVVNDFVTQKVDGIVLAPLDDVALRQPVKEAQSANIPVVIIDSGLKDITPVSFVATDNFKAGQAGGKKLVDLLGGKGKVLMLRYEEGSASTMERESGFLDALKSAPNITIVSDNQYGGATTDTAQKASENLIQKFNVGGSFVDGIFTPNESTTFGMLRALQDARLAGKVKFVGFDSSDALVKGMRDKQIDALVVQNPELMGYTGVKNLVDSIRGKKVDPKVDTGATVVDQKNMDTPDIAKLLAPPKI